MALQNGTAAQGVGSLNGGKTEKLGGTSYPLKYTLPNLSSMPSVEAAGKVAFIVARNGRLFAVGAFPAAGAL